MRKVLFWVSLLILVIIALVVIDLGYLPGIPSYARGFLWLFGVGGVVMWAAIFYISENMGFIANVLTALGLIGALYVAIRWGPEIIEFLHVSGLWDLLNIAG